MYEAPVSNVLVGLADAAGASTGAEETATTTKLGFAGLACMTV